MKGGKALFKRLAELEDQRKGFVLATLAEICGSAPRDAGAQMIIFPDGSFEFTIGGGTFEAEVVKDAVGMMGGESPPTYTSPARGEDYPPPTPPPQGGRSFIASRPVQEGVAAPRQKSGLAMTGARSEAGAGAAVLKEYELTPGKLDLYCAGTARVLFQVFCPPPHLLIFGGGHIGRALAKLAGDTGLFHVTVVDDRPEFAAKDAHPGARVVLTDSRYEKDVPAVDAGTFVVIVTRDHPTDRVLVRKYCGSKCAYIGMVGSQTKWQTFQMELKKQGVKEENLERVHAPIGIPIGGKLPEEIAVSILAELVKVKNEDGVRSQEPGSGKEIHLPRRPRRSRRM